MNRSGSSDSLREEILVLLGLLLAKKVEQEKDF